MAKQGRFFRPKPKALKGTIYDSMLEKRLHEGPFKKLEFHVNSNKIDYVIEHKYEPDFVYKAPDGTVIYIECKGYFQDSAEAQKYKWVKKSLKDNEILVFVFEKPDKEIHYQRKRTDGTKMTHREWCEKEGFICVSEQEAENVIK